MVASSSSLHRPHVLVVTDDEGLRDFLSEGLVIGGFWVSVVASALQTIEVFRLRTFDLAIIDLHLGGMSAVELVRRLRASGPAEGNSSLLTDIPMLGVAGSLDGGSIAQSESAGIDEVVVPPIELEELVPMLHSIVLNWRSSHPDRPWADELAQLRDTID